MSKTSPMLGHGHYGHRRHLNSRCGSFGPCLRHQDAPNSQKALPQKHAFTLTEMLVVIAILTILVAMLLSSLVSVREASRASNCQNNLRQIGIGLMLHADRSPGSELCSGMFDYNREGCSDTYGWVADQIRLGQAVPSNLKCPGNPLLVNEKLLDLYGIKTNDNLNKLTGNLRSRYTSGVCGDTEWNGITGPGDPDEGFASTDPATPARMDLVSRHFLAGGFNTNYVTSWFLCHTMPRVKYDAANNEIRTGGQAAQHGLRGRRESIGILRASFLAVTDIVSSRIPLLGDAAPGDLDEAVAPVAFEYEPGGTFGGSSSQSELFAPAGSLLSESSCEGPAFYHKSQKKIKRIGSAGSRLSAQLNCDRRGDCQPPTGSSGNNMYLQSTREWMAVHGGGSQASINLLFADGSVRAFLDKNGDRLLNPGFPVPESLSQQQKAASGYLDDKIELPSAQVFSGVFLVPSLIKAGTGENL